MIGKNIKKHLTGFSLVICYLSLGVALTSCEDFLVTESKSALSTDNAYSAAANIDQDLTGVYGALKPFALYYMAMSEFRSDNLFITTEQRTNEYSDCAQFNGTGLLNDNLISNCWADHYTLISAANVLLDHLGEAGLTEAQQTQYEAEARFLRALSYFDLVRFFGRVPISLHEISPAEAFSIPQSEAIDVYNKVIVPDLEYAIDRLQETATDYKGVEHSERVKRIAAQALLGKVYMQMAGYPLYQDTKAKAQALLAEVLTKESVYWVPTMDGWNRMWVHENDNKNFIFEIQYTADKGQGNTASPISKTQNTYADEYCNAYLTSTWSATCKTTSSSAIPSRMPTARRPRSMWTSDWWAPSTRDRPTTRRRASMSVVLRTRTTSW